jgi:predicted kinase
MQKLIVIRGAPASGKSTIAKRLRDFQKKIIWLKVDNFKDFFSEDGTDGLAYANEAALGTLKYLLNSGFSVIMEGIFQDTSYISKAAQISKIQGIPYKIFQIKCSLSILQERDKVRPGIKEGCRKPLGNETIAKLFAILENSYYPEAHELNTEKLTIEQSVDLIKNELTK